METLNEKTNYIVLKDQEKIYKELMSLKTNYTNLIKEVHDLENGQENIHDLRQDINSMLLQFNNINKNMEDITSKLDDMSELHMGNKKNTTSLKSITVSALSSILSIIDTTIEKTSGITEGLEDLFAEAQYENKRRRLGLKHNKLTK